MTCSTFDQANQSSLQKGSFTPRSGSDCSHLKSHNNVQFVLLRLELADICEMFSTSDEIPCDRDNPCQHGGTCSGTMLNYQCSCDVGYTGSNCESKYF